MDAYRRNRTLVVLAAIVAGTLFAMALRRPDQWAAPYLWIEEGTVMLPDFAANGWRTLFHPVNGYFLLPTKFILSLSATLSFRWLPEIEYWLTLAFTAGVLAAIAFSPTELKYRAACALAVLALPLDSEVYAMSSLAFWWGTLLVILPLLWRREGPQYPLVRWGFLVVGGMSSPLIIMLSPLYAARALWLRTRGAWIDLGVAALVALIQANSVLKTAQASNAAFKSITPWLFVQKFFGYFVYIPTPFASHGTATFLAGAALLTAIAVCTFRYRRELGSAYFMLLAIFIVAAFASALRVPIEQLHPSLAGPRYFFLPFAMLSWAILQFVAIDARFPQMIAVAVLALVARNVLDVGQRNSDKFDWRAHVAACIDSDRHEFPVGYDGRAAAAWKVQLSGADCRRLVAQSWFANGVSAGAAR